MVTLFLTLVLLGDWPQFRGATDGRVVDQPSPMEWSDTNNVVWKVSVPGLGWSSPVIAKDRVYLTTAVPRGEGLTLRALAYDVKTGKQLWDREVRSLEKVPSIHSKNSHASPTPIVADDAVYVHFGTFGTAKLDAIDGTVTWKTTELVYPPMHGSGGSPVLADGKLVIVCDGSTSPFVVALDASNGKIAWKTTRSVEAKISHSFVTAAVAKVGERFQVFAPGPDHFASYDLDTGKELWKILAPGWSVVPQPIVTNGMVIYNHDYDNPELIAAKIDGTGDVTESNVVWRLKKGAPSTPTPLLVGDELYFVSDTGVVSCVDVKTGEKHWMERLGGNFSASPILVNNHVLFLDENGIASWIKPGKEFVVVGKNELPGRTFATPAFSNGSMYLRTDEALYKFSN